MPMRTIRLVLCFSLAATTTMAQTWAGSNPDSRFVLLEVQPVQALPPPEDIPEEVLRTEIITEGRSPLNGAPLTAAEYAELQNQLETGPSIQPPLNPEVENVVYLLRLRRIIRSVFPFLLR